LTASGRFSALRNRDFALFWSANVVSRIGTQMRDVALAWHLYLLTRSPLALGLLGAARVVPIVLLGMGGGVVADAFDRRRLMLVTQTVLAATSAVLAALTFSGHARPPWLYGLVAIAAAASAFDAPARQALNVNLLPEEDLSNGLTLGIAGFQVATVVGPAVGGVLLSATSIGALYAIDAASFLAVLAALAIVRPRASSSEGAGERAPKAAGLGALVHALRFVWRQKVLVWLMVVDFLATFFAGSLLLLPIFASEVFGGRERSLGLLTAAPAVGSLAATLWLGWRAPIRRAGPVFLGAVAIYGLAVAGFGVARSLPLGLALLALSGAADAVSTVVRQVARHTLTPDELRGRMVGINMIFFIGGPQLGEVEAGLVAQWTSARISVVSGGVACVLVALAVAAFVPSLRRVSAAEAARARG
jgi:MFS family permease